MYGQPYEGASWDAPLLGSPMDLSAAVDPTYMVQLTNAGMYVFNKTTGAFVKAFGLRNFWCGGTGVNGSPLQDCTSSEIPSDVQIAHTNLYPGGRWVATTMSPDQTYLWLGISQTSDPTGAWFLWSFPGCQDFLATYPNMDQPILGVSNNESGGAGRIIVGMR